MNCQGKDAGVAKRWVCISTNKSKSQIGHCRMLAVFETRAGWKIIWFTDFTWSWLNTGTICRPPSVCGRRDLCVGSGIHE